MPTTLDVFISSKMLELKPERDALFALLKTLDYGDIKLHAWVFERDAPASSRSIREVYLGALQNAALYIGLLWNEFGEWTVDELERATEWGIERHVYVKDVDAHKRDPRLTKVIDKYGPVAAGITARWFTTLFDLEVAVRQSIEAWISDRLRSRPGGPTALLARHPDDLAERPRRLIGRDGQLSELSELLSAGERVLLQGFGGMGKTALAATAAARWIEASRGPVLWLKAGHSDAAELLRGLARPLGTYEQIARKQGEELSSAVRSAVRQSGVTLVVLDDCWNGRALFAVLKALPGDVAALVTARQRYAVDTMRDVGELPEASAVELLVLHSKQDAGPDAFALCRKLAFHPFSIEVAGKTLKVRKWTPGELLTRIADAPHEMRMPGDFSERERGSVKDLLDASLRTLDDGSRAVFLAFGAFPTPKVTVQMLAQFRHSAVVWSDEALTMPAVVGDGLGDEQVRAALQDLEVQGLAERAPVTTRPVQRLRFDPEQGDWQQVGGDTEQVEPYRIHDLAFSYVRAQADDASRRKALDICLAFTFFHASSGPAGYDALRGEIDNLLGAATFALDRGHYRYVERFATNLWFVSRFLEFEADPRATRLLEQAVEAATKRGDIAARYRFLGNLGKAYLDAGDFERALQFTREALATARQHGDEEVEQLMLTNIGACHLGEGDLANADKALAQALEIARRRGDRQGEAQLLGNLGIASERGGQYDNARSLYSAAGEIGKDLHDDNIGGINLINLAGLLFRTRKYSEAVEAYREGIETLRRIGNARAEASAWHGLGLVYDAAGDLAAAVDAWSKAGPLFQRTGNDEMGEICAKLVTSARSRNSADAPRPDAALSPGTGSGHCACGLPLPSRPGVGELVAVDDDDAAKLTQLFRGQLDAVTCQGCGRALPPAPTLLVSFDGYALELICWGPAAKAQADFVTGVEEDARAEGTIVRSGFQSAEELRSAAWEILQGRALAFYRAVDVVLSGGDHAAWDAAWPEVTSSAVAALVASRAARLPVDVDREIYDRFVSHDEAARSHGFRQVQARVWQSMCERRASHSPLAATLEQDLRRYASTGALIAGAPELFFEHIASLDLTRCDEGVRHAYYATEATLHDAVQTPNPHADAWASSYLAIETGLASDFDAHSTMDSLRVSELRARHTIDRQSLTAAVTQLVAASGPLDERQWKSIQAAAAKAGYADAATDRG